MRPRVLAAGAVALAVLGFRANPAAAQVGAGGAEADPRWQPWIGCWEQVGAPPPGPAAVLGTGLVCVIPAEGGSAVDILAVANGRVTTREHIDATGERRESVRNGCSGWEQAEWSEDGRRVYLRAAHLCPNGAARNASGLLAFSPVGTWLDVQCVAVGAYPGVRVVRYREVAGADSLPDEVARAIAGRAADYWAVRAAAGGPLGAAEVIEAAGRLDAVAVESWLVERGEGFDLSADRLIDLSDQGVPDRVIDLMVALSYPGVFSVSAATRGGARIGKAEQADSSSSSGATGYGSTGYFGDRFYSPFGWDPYAYGFGGYGYGGWYWGNRPIIIVGGGTPGGGGGGTGGGPDRHGRVVNGRGYSGGDNTGPQARPNPGTGSGSASSGGYVAPQQTGSGSGSGSTSSGSGSSTSTGRTAHPRP